MTIPVPGQISRDVPSDGPASNRPRGRTRLSSVSGIHREDGANARRLPL